MRYPEASEVEAIRRDLQQRISDGKEAEAELSQLEEWLKAGESIFSRLKAAGGDGMTGATFREPLKVNRLASSAESVLKRTGKLHINPLMDQMRKEGWISTGDNHKDMKNVYASLSKNKRFANLGRNVWDLAKEGEEK
jgi:hypothetical protein